MICQDQGVEVFEMYSTQILLLPLVLSIDFASRCLEAYGAYSLARHKLSFLNQSILAKFNVNVIKSSFILILCSHFSGLFIKGAFTDLL